jgi:hypothetical protein
MSDAELLFEGFMMVQKQLGLVIDAVGLAIRDLGL